MTRDRKLINEIRKVREVNNSLWMELLHLALASAPKQAKTILSEITKNDQKVSQLTKKLAK